MIPTYMLQNNIINIVISLIIIMVNKSEVKQK
jgi:hypothetical protein